MALHKCEFHTTETKLLGFIVPPSSSVDFDEQGRHEKPIGYLHRERGTLQGSSLCWSETKELKQVDDHILLVDNQDY